MKKFIKSTVSLLLAITMIMGASAVSFAADPAETVEVLANNGMVSSAHPQSSAIGVEVLKNGGNAMDAAIATAFSLGMTEPFASGIGGSGLMLYYDASTGKTTSIEYLVACPQGQLQEMYLPDNVSKAAAAGMTGYRAGAPGFVAGMLKAHELFATKPLEELLQPTIDLAENGAVVSEFFAVQNNNTFEKLILCPETDRVFNNMGFPYMEGELFTNPDYAKTLRIILEKGVDGFYKGEVAQAIVDSLRKAGGVLTMEDLAKYHVDVKEPYSTTYRKHRVETTPLPSAGAVILASLNLAELFNMDNYEHNSAKYLHLWSEIFKVGQADRIAYINDPEYYATGELGARGLITKEYARSRRHYISPNSALPLGPDGHPSLFADFPESHTTHLAVMDKDGNVCSMTNTNGNFYGCRITVDGYGFLMNDLTHDYSSENQRPQPGKKQRQPMCPVILFYPDGTPYAAIGTPGSGRIMTTNTLIVSNIVDYGMDIQTALDVPRIEQTRNGPLVLEYGIDESVLPELKEIGHKVSFYGEAISDYFGGAHAVLRDKNGVFHGGADPRRSGAAVGY